MIMRFVLYLLAYLAPSFLLGFVWHLRLFEDRYKALGIYRDSVVIPLGLASMVVQGCAVAWLYPRLMAHPSSMADGLTFAAGAALLSWSFTTLAVGAKHPMTSVAGYLVIETGFTLVQFLLVGPLLALASRGGPSGG
jgi:hydrogenase-4 membrane subunit HyfE